jgi:DNA invertase Pin-like site-specific DNA recombinase
MNRVLTHNNIALRPQGYYQKKLNAHEEAEVVRLYQKGLSKAKLAEQFGISSTVVSETLKRNNIESKY